MYAWLGIKAVLGNWAPSPGKKEIELRTQQMTRTIEARRGLKNLRSIILRPLRVFQSSFADVTNLVKLRLRRRYGLYVKFLSAKCLPVPMQFKDMNRCFCIADNVLQKVVVILQGIFVIILAISLRQ